MQPSFQSLNAVSRQLIYPRSSWRRRPASVIVCLLVAVSACRDAPTTAAGISNAGRGVNTVSSPDSGGLQAQPQFDLNLTIRGSLRPGEPVIVEMTTRALVGSHAAVRRIALPDLEMAKLSGWETVKIRTGTELPAAVRTSRALAGGEIDRLVASLVIPREGYYRIVASVFGDSLDAKTYNGRPVQDRMHVERWVYVAENGGAVTATFDPTVLPEGIQARPGPSRLKRSRTMGRRLASTTEEAVTAGVRSSLLEPVTRQVTYYDYDNPQNPVVRPLANVSVYQEEFDQYEYRSYGGSWTTTDANGEFTAICAPLDYYTIRGRVELRGGGLQMGEPTATYWEEYFGDCYEVRGPYGATTNANAFVFSQMREIVAASRAELPARGDVLVEVVNGLGISYYLKEQPWGPYGNSDIIKIAGDGANQGVYGPYGAFVQAHEYGHAVHHRALGNYQSSDCGSGHTLGSVESYGCSYVEGVADFLAAVTRPTQMQYFLGYIQNRDFFTTGVAGRQEIQVAAFLLDLSDAANDESHDQVSYPLPYIGAVIQTCRVFDGDIWVWNGGDYLAECFEQGLSSSDHATFFPNRIVLSFAENAAEPANWCKAGIRRVWKWNMGGVYEPTASCN